MTDDLMLRIAGKKRTIRCRRCPWVKMADALEVVVAYEAHLNEVHMGLGDIGHLEVDEDRAREVASFYAFEAAVPRAMRVGRAGR